MLTAVAALTVIVLALIAERVVLYRSIERERAALTDEREALRLEATDERRELLTRLQHPQLVVSKAPEQQVVQQPVADDTDEWAKVGTVQSTVDEPDEIEPA